MGKLFIELTEYLRCPTAHENTYCVLSSEEMAGRHVVSGTVGCPVCHNEYHIREGVLFLSEDETSTSGGDVSGINASGVQALLALQSPGGYVVLIGSASLLAPQLIDMIGMVHFVGVNSPEPESVLPSLSSITRSHVLPLRNSFCRGVVIGSEYCQHHWLEESARILLSGQRLVALAELDGVNGLETLAVGEGMWVGRKISAGNADSRQT